MESLSEDHRPRKRNNDMKQMVKVMMNFVSLVKEFGKQLHASLTQRKVPRTFNQDTVC